jgi:antitoxin (DNA-binding transcriptional repressor) of toxin-antitoxin stability system
MSTHSVAEAESKLSELIDRALDGEGVTTTRDGEPVVELKPVAREAERDVAKTGAMTEAELRGLRVIRAVPSRIKAAAAAEVRKMREEGEEWAFTSTPMSSSRS